MKPTAIAAAVTAAFALTGAAPAAAPAHAAGTTKTAVFAGGCFWSVEHDLEHLPGVVDVVVGYAGGARPKPSYENHEGYLESVRVTYDPAKTSYAQLVDGFFHHIDPIDSGGQICDRGHSYTTAVFVADEAERQAAIKEKAQVAKELGKPVATRILWAGKFWMGESYHQDYARKNPANYQRYRIGCGRDRALKAVWGSAYRS